MRRQFHSVPRAFELHNGNRIHPSTACRYTRIGVLVNGERIILQSWKVGGRRMTTLDAVDEFIRKQTEASKPQVSL